MAAAVAATSAPALPRTKDRPPAVCPQCGNFWGSGSLFVRDTCGHRKCRTCVIVEGDECGTCIFGAKTENGQLGANRPASVQEAGKVDTEPSNTQLSNEISTSGLGHIEVKIEASANVVETDYKMCGVCELPVSETQAVDSKAANTPSGTLSTERKKRSLPGQCADKKVLDELNVANASNVPACKSEENSEAVDDPEEPQPDNEKPAVQRRAAPAHGVTKLPGSPTVYYCTICNRKFKSRSTIRYHYYCGLENKPLTCDLCNKGFIIKSHLEYHMRDHLGDLPFSCEVCGKGFKQKAKLKRHSIVHTNDRRFACSTCGKCFAEASALKVHSRLHTSERPYKCDQCGKGFNENVNYQRHLRSIHTGERPFACELCGKCFARAENLKVHQRRHRGIRPYECSICSFTFSHKKDMLRHRPVHDPSSRPFECKICLQTFKRKDTLMRHNKLTHNEYEKDDEAACSETVKEVAGEAKNMGNNTALVGKNAGDTTEEEKTVNTAGNGSGDNASKENENPTRERPVRTARNERSDNAIKESDYPTTESAIKAAENESGDNASKKSENPATENAIPVTDAADTTPAKQTVPPTAPVGGTDVTIRDASATPTSATDSNSNIPLRKRRVRTLPSESTLRSPYPVFRRNVTPPPGALLEPPRVPRHCLPTPRDRRAVLTAPVPVDVLNKKKRQPRRRTYTRKWRRKDVSGDSMDIEKVGFIQVPQYPPKARAAPRAAPATVAAVAESTPKQAETCTAVPVIKRPQPSNCVRTITKAPHKAVSTIVSPRIRRIAPKPPNTAPPLPQLPARPPRPDQPMLRMLLHDTPCSNGGSKQIPERTPAAAPPRPPPAVVTAPVSPGPKSWPPYVSTDELSMMFAYEYLMNGNLGQPTDRQTATADWQHASQKSLPLAECEEHSASPLIQQQPPFVQSQPQLARKRPALPQKHHLLQQYQQQQQDEQQLLWPMPGKQEQKMLVSPSTSKGKQKRTSGDKQTPPTDSLYNLDELDVYCSYTSMNTKKQMIPGGKKPGKSVTVEEKQRPAYKVMRRPGKRMSAISDRLSDDNEDCDDEALNYTLCGSGSSGKKFEDLYITDYVHTRDSYGGPPSGSCGGKTADMLDVVAEFSDGADRDSGVQDLSFHQELAELSSAQQPPVIVGTGKLSDIVPYD